MNNVSKHFCLSCREKTRHTKARMINDQVGLVLTLLTLGGFLLIWIPCFFIDAFFQSWWCDECGSKNN